MTVVVQQQMQLSGSLGTAEFGPIEGLRTQIDHGGVNAHELVLETEFMLAAGMDGGCALALPQKLMEYFLVHLPWPVFIGVGQSGACRCLRQP
jgi:hypothetical protein